MERIIRFFVERHLLVNVLTFAILSAGIMTAARRDIEGFPTVTIPRFMVTASLPGASARDVEAKVTIPIEEALREVDGLDNYSSVISDNRSVTEIELDDDTPPKIQLAKEREIRTAIDGITDFPPEMTDEPSILHLDPSKSPVLEIALTPTRKDAAIATMSASRSSNADGQKGRTRGEECRLAMSSNWWRIASLVSYGMRQRSSMRSRPSSRI